MLLTDALGFIAGALTSFSLIPQVIRVFKLKSVREISLLYTVLFFIGLTIWLAYGIVNKLAPLILWNAVGLGLDGGLLYAKLKYGRLDGKQ